MTIPDHYQIKYGNTWREKLQEAKARFLPFVTYKGDCRGRYATIEQIDPIDLDEKTTRHQASILTEPTTSRRFMFPRSFNKMVGFDEDDGWKLNSIEVPIMPSANELYKGGQRKFTEVIFDGINGSNTVGNGEDEAMTTETFAAGNIIAVTVGDADGAGNTNTDMNTTKIRLATQGMMEDEVLDGDNGEDETVLALSARQVNSLWDEAIITSRDFSRRETLDLGKLEGWLGHRIIRSQLVPKTGNNRECLLWAKSKVHFGIWDNWQSRMWIDETTGGTRYRVKVSIGACREQMEGVRRILCDETAAFGA